MEGPSESMVPENSTPRIGPAWGGERVFAFPLDEVHAVEAEGLDFDDCFAGFGYWLGDCGGNN